MRKSIPVLIYMMALALLCESNEAQANQRRRRASCQSVCCVPVCQPTACYPQDQSTAGMSEPLPPGIIATKYFRSPKGNQHLLYITNVREPEPAREPQPVPPGVPSPRPHAIDGETFNGSDRRAAKLSISTAGPKPPLSLA